MHRARVVLDHLRSCRVAGETTSKELSQDGEGPCTRLEIGGGVAKLTLCRSKKLNSLSLALVEELREQYAAVSSAKVGCLLLGGEGRAFSAGGDVSAIRQGILVGNRLPAEFFYREYLLDHEIATLQEREGILQVALWNGLVLGGGVGLSVHSPVRVATEKTIFGMPECKVGLFADVSMTWVLSRLPLVGEAFGLYIALTGQRLTATDCLYAGLATHYCPSEKLPLLEEALRGLGAERCRDLQAVSAAITKVSNGARPDEAKAVLAPNAAAIERCFGDEASTAETIAAKLEAEGCTWSQQALAGFRQGSPTSVKVTLEAVRRHRRASLREAFIAEYRITQRFMRPQPFSDFMEGVRAMLVDKDGKPSWDPARLDDVSREQVKGFFEALEEGHPLGELPL